MPDASSIARAEDPPVRSARVVDPKEAKARAIDRLRRLRILALGTDHEAAAARSLAEQLERRTGIAIRIIRTTEVPTTFPPPPIIRISGAGGLPLLEWEGRLIECMSRLFGVLVVRQLDALAFVGDRQRVEHAVISTEDLFSSLHAAFRHRQPEEHYGRSGVAYVARYDGGPPIIYDVQGWEWEFSIAWAYAAMIRLLTKFSREQARPTDLASARAAKALDGRRVTEDPNAGTLPVMQSDARVAGTVEAQRAQLEAVERRLAELQ